MFRNMDCNGNGFLSLREVERYLEKTLGATQLGEVHEAVVAAFEGAKGLRRSRDHAANDMVDIKEYIQFLADLKRFFFNEFVDASGRATDGYMDFAEFNRLINQLRNWGVEDDAAVVFKAITDQRRVEHKETGTITWGEITQWLHGTAQRDFDFVEVEDNDPTGLGASGLRLAPDGSIVVDDGQAVADDLTSGVSLPELISLLPCDKYDSGARERRKALWNSFDASGNGGLTLSEVTKGVLSILKTRGDTMVKALNPAIARAFHAAKDATEGGDPMYVTRGEEFRLLFVYLKRYFELLVAFDRIDTSDDRKVDRKEFGQALPLLAGWGIAVGDSAAEFAKMDRDGAGAGAILFDEFCAWALSQGLDLDPSDTLPAERNVIKHHKSSADVALAAVEGTAKRVRDMDARAGASGRAEGDATQHLDLHAILGKLPIAGKDPTDAAARERLFESADASNNGALSMAEVQMCLGSLLGLQGQQTKRAFAPAVRAAFEAAKDAGGQQGAAQHAPVHSPVRHAAAHAAETIDRVEFETLLLYLRRYFELLVAFDRIDTSDDRKVDRKEFGQALPLLYSWGVVIANMEAEFRAIDKEGSNRISFDAFAEWALRKGLNVWHGCEGDDEKAVAKAVERNRLDGELAERHIALRHQRESRSPRPASQQSPRRGSPLESPSRPASSAAALRAAAASPRRRGLLQMLDVRHMSPEYSFPALVYQLPCGKTEADKLGRAELFAIMDAEGRGAVYPADVDAGLRRLLKLDAVGGGRGWPDEAHSPAIEAAFHSVTQFMGAPEERHLNRANLRQFLSELKWYTNSPSAVEVRTQIEGRPVSPTRAADRRMQGRPETPRATGLRRVPADLRLRAELQTEMPPQTPSQKGRPPVHDGHIHTKASFVPASRPGRDVRGAR